VVEPSGEAGRVETTAGGGEVSIRAPGGALLDHRIWGNCRESLMFR